MQPFDAEVILLPMPGRVIADSVSFSRRLAFEDPPKSSGGFIQVDDLITFSPESQTVTHISGHPIEPDKIYLTGILFMACTGCDNIEPLMEWAKGHSELFPLDAAAEMGRPAKLLLVDYFSKSIWFSLGNFEELAQPGAAEITRDDVASKMRDRYGDDLADICIDNVLHVADTDGSGSVSREELLRMHLWNPVARRMMDSDRDNSLDREEILEFASKAIGEQYATTVVDQLFGELDQDRSGSVSSHEVQLWLSRNFKLETVTVPGQNLERGEIVAVQARMKNAFA